MPAGVVLVTTIMRVALLADLHGNFEALNACMRHARAQGVDRFAFLGDLVGYGADPCAVLERVAREAEQGAVVVGGNHDAAVAGPDDGMNDDARRAMDWTRRQLDRAHTDFIAGLPLLVRDESICHVHASACEPQRWIYITDDIAASRSLASVDSTWTFCGHVHDQVLYYQGAGRRLMAFRPTPGVTVPVGAHRRWLAIVGSAGQPRDHNTAAAYALFDRARGRLVFHRVPYDHFAAAAKIRAAGLPEALAACLERGA